MKKCLLLFRKQRPKKTKMSAKRMGKKKAKILAPDSPVDCNRMKKTALTTKCSMQGRTKFLENLPAR